MILGLALAAVIAATSPDAAAAAVGEPCSPAAAQARTASMVRSLNAGRADRFAAGFALRGRWHPFTRSVRRPGFIGRARIQAFAVTRVVARERWRVGPPRRVGRSAYVVTVAVADGGEPIGRGSTRLVLDCGSGLVSSWVGPSLRLPPLVDDD